MIQPSFMFMVGVSLAYSFAKRQQRGDRYRSMFWHAVRRALILILLGVFLRSFNFRGTYWTFEDVLTQIGLGYVFLFLLAGRPLKWQLTALVLISGRLLGPLCALAPAERGFRPGHGRGGRSGGTI